MTGVVTNNARDILPAGYPEANRCNYISVSVFNKFREGSKIEGTRVSKIHFKIRLSLSLIIKYNFKINANVVQISLIKKCKAILKKI